MSRNSPDQYRHHRATIFFEETIGLLQLEIGINPRLGMTEDHCPRRTINQHVRSLEFALEFMQGSDAKVACQERLAECKRNIAKRDGYERRRQIRAVQS